MPFFFSPRKPTQPQWQIWYNFINWAFFLFADDFFRLELMCLFFWANEQMREEKINETSYTLQINDNTNLHNNRNYVIKSTLLPDNSLYSIVRVYHPGLIAQCFLSKGLLIRERSIHSCSHLLLAGFLVHWGAGFSLDWPLFIIKCLTPFISWNNLCFQWENKRFCSF